MQNIGSLSEAIEAFKQSRTAVKTLLDRNQTAINQFADALTRRQAMPTPASPPVNPVILGAAGNSLAMSSGTHQTPPSFLEAVSAARDLAPQGSPMLPAATIPAAQQNVIDSSMRSNYVYTADSNGDRTLLSLEDGLRRATDSYDAMLANAKGGYCSWIPSANGLPVYLSREQMIGSAKDNLQQAQQRFDAHKSFLANPVARAAAEVAYQIQYGAPSVGGPELSPLDQILVQARRAGDTTTDGSILLLKKTGA